MLRIQPLTSLFLIATLLSDALLIGQPADPPANYWLALGYLLGQSTVLGTWFAVGQPQRLVRGALFVAGILGLTITAHSHGVWVQPNFWGRLVAVVSLYGAVAFGVNLLATLLLAVRRRSTDSQAELLRFPLVELFGWTIIVALGSLVVQAVDFSVLMRRHELLTFHLSSATIASIAAWTFTKPGSSLAGKFMVIAFLELAFFCLLPHYSLSNSTAIGVIGLTHSYVGLWLLIQLLDQRQQRAIGPSILTEDVEATSVEASASTL